jgi:hypothetical protein
MMMMMMMMMMMNHTCSTYPQHSDIPDEEDKNEEENEKGKETAFGVWSLEFGVWNMEYIHYMCLYTVYCKYTVCIYTVGK